MSDIENRMRDVETRMEDLQDRLHRLVVDVAGLEIRVSMALDGVEAIKGRLVQPGDGRQAGEEAGCCTK